MFIKLYNCINGRGSGRGLAPTRGPIHCNVTYCYIARVVLIRRGSVYVVCHGYMVFHVTMYGARGELHRCNHINHLLPCARSYEPYAQVPRRLGAGAPLTVLRFALLARLRPVLGFHALYCV
jgi:hypothetical protein